MRPEFRPFEYKLWILFIQVSAAASPYTKDSTIPLSHITYTGQVLDNNCIITFFYEKGKLSFSCRSILSPILGINFSVLSYQNFYSCFQKNDKINYSPSSSLGSPFAGGVNEQWIGHKTGRNIRKKSRQFR